MPFPQRLGTVLALWRFPVKSMRGESPQEVHLTPAGLEGDRVYALGSTAAPAGKPLLSSHERTASLRYTARWLPQPTVTVPGGLGASSVALALPSPALLEHLQTTVARPGAQLTLHHCPADPFFDVRPVSLLTQSTLEALARERGCAVDPLRFRSNLVLALEGGRPFAEDRLAGATLAFGTPQGPQLRILERIPRCRIVSLDPATTEADPTLLRHLAQHHAGRIGVYARVLKPGTLHTGDAVFQLSSAS